MGSLLRLEQMIKIFIPVLFEKVIFFVGRFERFEILILNLPAL
jgi:hypothetical protein